jgi:putative ABC transport system permease protein
MFNLGALFKIFTESFRQAFQQLNTNRLRSFLSLLGISIGIFCIIGVQSAMDSLEDNIRSSFDKFGDDVVYVSKFSWEEPPEESWWKYMKRPNPSYEDYEYIKERAQNSSIASFYFFIGGRTVKYRSSSLERVFLIGITYEYGDIFELNVVKGRYFSPSEYYYGASKVLIGYDVAENLFGTADPIGKRIDVGGKKAEVIGVLEKSGDELLTIIKYDSAILLPYAMGKQYVKLSGNGPGGGIAVKAKGTVGLETLKDELTRVVRAGRRLRPKEPSDFSLNTLSLFSNVLDSFFSVLNILGLVIGIFAIFVGAISVANIMFVSVKERTNLIGIKKALGAKRFVILLEFLTESIILCMIGGLGGLMLVWMVTKVLSPQIAFDIYLSYGNVIWGFVWSFAIGIVSGFIPAFQASRLNPVDAIRAK